jgi:hypothetical protein
LYRDEAKQNDGTELRRVLELLDHATGKWDGAVVNATLCPLDAAAVLRLPRPTNGGEDFWAWSEEKTGTYTLRSAYYMLVQHVADNPGSSTSEQQWKKLWQLKVIPKVRIFL